MPIRRSPRHDLLREILASQRDAAGVTQVELAARLRRPQSWVSKVENGERRIDVVEFLEVVEALGCSAHDILFELDRRHAALVAKPKRGRSRKAVPS